MSAAAAIDLLNRNALAGSRSSLVVAVDIGTTKVACVIGDRNALGTVDIIGVGTHPSSGLRKGVVINIEDTVHSIKAAIDEAEMMAGVEVGSVLVGIAGGHIRSMNSEGMVPIRSGQVATGDIQKVLDTAQALAIPMDQEVIHVIPQEFKVDDQEGIEDPRGMSGVRLASKVHIVTAAVTAAQNIVRCCNLTGLNVRDIVLEPLASSEAVLSEDERQLGVMMVDIGGGTTDVAIFCDGAIVHSYVLPVGGDHITHDIAWGLRAPIDVAERIKRDHGCAQANLVQQNAGIEVPRVGGDRVEQTTRAMLAEIIEPRVHEMFELLGKDLRRGGFSEVMPAGVVLSGGAALMPGMVEAAERVLGMPARRGGPRDVGGLSDVVTSPIYATAVGLVKFGMKHPGGGGGFNSNSEPASLYGRVKGRMSEWLGMVF